MSAQQKTGNAELVIGGEPRADLLPPELKQAARGRALRRGMIALVVTVLFLVGASYIGAFFVAQQSQEKLDAANQRTTDLLAEKAQFVEVNRVTGLLELAHIAQEVGTSTQIDWKPFLEEARGLLPRGMVVTALTVNSATPMSPFPDPTVPLRGERIASLTFTGTTPALPDIEALLESLSGLTGYVDAWPGTVTAGEGGYQLSITVHVDEAALSPGSLREDETESPAGEADEAEAAEAGTGEER